MTTKRRRPRSPKRRTTQEAEIERLQVGPPARAELTADRVLEELRRLACADIRRQLFTAAGDLKPLHTLPPEVTACIAAVEFAPSGDVLNIQLWDQRRALTAIAAARAPRSRRRAS